MSASDRADAEGLLLLGVAVKDDGLVAIDLEAWKAQARAGAAPARALLFKQYVPLSVVKSDGEKDRLLTFTISTGAVDRDRDTIAVEGWVLDNYLANPVVLWAHCYREPPVGKAEAVVKAAGALKATARFATAEEYPFADTIYRLLLGGYLRAVSVGFAPAKSVFNEERIGWDFLEQELREFSVVPVPSNPEALLDAKADGVDIAPLRKWCEQVLDSMEPGLWIPRAAAERVLKIAGVAPVSVPVPAPPVVPSEQSDPAVKVAVPENSPPSFLTPDVIRAAARAAVSGAVEARINRALGRLD